MVNHAGSCKGIWEMKDDAEMENMVSLLQEAGSALLKKYYQCKVSAWIFLCAGARLRSSVFLIS